MPSRPVPVRPLALALGALTLAAASPAARAQGPTAGAAARPVADSVSYREPFRPQFHFTPAVNWMNDPNGMVYLDGEWHLFYQHNPFGNRWGHMSWGHAVSRDLVHWEHLPVAIPEVGDEMVFSGSAVVDWKNTSGFGTAGRPPMVAIWTAHDEKRKHQAQALAYSTDRGRTWTRYAGNPVLDLGLADFRDPKVMWHAGTGRWVMTVALPTERKLRFYASPDLKRWTLLSEFGPAGAVAGIWECPDLFELPVDGNPRNTRWVAIVNLSEAVAGGSGTQYFVGRFDGTRFTPEPMGRDSALWLDRGRDNYAGVTFADVPRTDGRRVFIGWMNQWQYANDVPTSPWRSATTVPRTLALRTTPDGIRLVQQPVRELERLRGAPTRVAARAVAEGTTPLPAVRGQALDLVAEFAVGTGTTAGEFGLKVRTGAGEETVIGVDPRAGQLYVDRSRAGRGDFHKAWSERPRQTAPLPVANGRVRLRVLVDHASVEVFAGDGRSVITDQIFPAASSDGVALFATGGTARLVALTAWPMRSAWRSPVAVPAGTARPTETAAGAR